MDLAEKIIEAIRFAIQAETAVLHEPRFNGNEHVYVKDCIDSTFVSSIGTYVTRFEMELASYVGSRRAVAVVNGTAALQVAMQLAGVESDDEVLVPALTFVATANAVVYLGAVPHFVDCEEQTLGMDPVGLRNWLEKIAEIRNAKCINRLTGRRIAAIVPVHCFGHPCQIQQLVELAEDYHLTMVEDAAEALGSRVQGRHTGSFGLLGTISFNGNKIVTTGGGGAILTDDDQLADRAKHLTTTAKVPHRWEYVHDEIGYNFRMPNLNAAMGCGQLEQLEPMLASKRLLFEQYCKAFSDLEGLRLLAEPEGACSNYWLQTIILEEGMSDQRDAILTATNDAGLMTRPAWRLLHQLPAFADCPQAPLPVAENLARRIINLPSSAGLA